MDEDQQVWEKRSIKIILGFRKGVLIYGIVVMVLMIAYLVGVPKTVEQTVPAYVITQTGNSFPCELYMTGEVTEYPLKNLIRRREDYAYHGSVTVQINGKRLGILDFDISDIFYALGTDHISQCLLRRDRGFFFAKTSAEKFFPEQKDAACVIIAPAESEQEAMAILNAQELMTAHLEDCQWLLK